MGNKNGVLERGVKLHPTQVIVAGFVVLILLGAVLLSLPAATTTGRPLSFLDAFFTSTSAVCVTGLVVTDTGTTFSLFGQIVLLVLFQVGALGLMTVTTMVFFLAGKRITLSERMIIREMWNEFDLSGMVKLVLKVIRVTLIAELTGALLLAIRFVPMFGLKGVYYSVFHAVSAFSSAGFDLMGREFSPYCSMAPFASDPLVLLTLIVLVYLGGLGFWVITDIFSISRIRERRGLSRYTKLVLVTNLILIVLGLVSVYAAELGNDKTLGALGTGDAVLGGFFQALTPRTGGFSTIHQGDLMPVTKFVMILLMFIGASPASTGGGIKTTTAAVVALFAFSGILGRRDITLRRRRVSPGTVQRAIVIALTGFVLVMAASLTLMAIESGHGGLFTSENILYEVVAAFGTAGLSTGITPHLSAASRIVLMVVMFVGRIGLMTLVIALTSRAGQMPSGIRYPEERFMVG